MWTRLQPQESSNSAPEAHEEYPSNFQRFSPTAALLIPLTAAMAGIPSLLRGPLNLYDGGLLLTLARFTTFTRLPYRDLWTLYGPGPAIVGSIMNLLFGPGLVQLHLGMMLSHLSLVFGVYFLARRFVSWWLAAVMAAAVASFAQSPPHFTLALTLFVWGFFFLARVQDRPDLANRRVSIGSLLIGSAFLGRYEHALLSVVLIMFLWLYLRPSLTPEAARRLLGWGLGPVVVFGIYLLAIVGWNRAYLNLVEYPLNFYAKPFCRGVPTPWAQALAGLLAPLRGRLWQGNELALGAGTYIAPFVSIGTILIGIRKGTSRSYTNGVTLAIGLLSLIMWLQMRPRAGPEPYPTWAPMLLATAIAIGSLRITRFKASTYLSIAIAGVFLLNITLVWAPDKVHDWSDWPPYDPLLGFTDKPSSGLYHEAIWEEVRRAVDAHASPGDPIFVALNENGGHFANAPIFYWYLNRPPGSRFIEFDPCLTDTEPVQREIVRELRQTNVVVTTTFFPNDPPPFGTPAVTLDQYLDTRFEHVLERSFPQPEPGAFAQRISVLVRRGFVVR